MADEEKIEQQSDEAGEAEEPDVEGHLMDGPGTVEGNVETGANIDSNVDIGRRYDSVSDI